MSRGPDHPRNGVPAGKDHRDPFDRLLMAQAEFEGMALLTADRQLAGYRGVELLWA